MRRALVFSLLLPTGALAAATPGFDPESAAPYFAEGKGAEAMRRFRAEDWTGAARGFTEHALELQKDAAHAKEAPQARFLAAYALSKAGRFAEAATAFDGLVADYPLLADYHRLYAARALLGAKRHEEALKRARSVSQGTPLDAEAGFARAEALRGMKLWAEAEREYQAYVDAYPKSWREPEARSRLAEVKTERKLPAAEVDAIYKYLYVHFPTESAAREAEKALRREAPALLQLNGAEHLARGLALFEEMRNEASEAELRAALAAGDLGATERCQAAFHMAQSVFKQRQRPRAAALFDDAVAICEKAPREDAASADLHAKGLYQAGRCHGARDELQQAIACYQRIQKEHPTHSYGDDAQLRQAEMYVLLAQAAKSSTATGTPAAASPPAAPTGGDAKQAAVVAPAPPSFPLSAEQCLQQADSLLAGIPTIYPNGDQGGEALFRLAFRAFRDRRLDDARRWLTEELQKFPREDGWWEAGRTLYWLGRVAAEQGKADEAKERYTRAAREYPLAYYTLAALNRLRDQWPDEEKKLVESLRTAPTDKDAKWQFAPRPLFGEPGFRRGVELARLGLGTEAKRELAALGIKVVEKGPKPQGAEAEELLWVAGVLYDRAGEWSLSHAIPRHILTDYAKGWPVADNRKRWLLSYPRGYAELVIDNTGKTGHPAALEFAIIREESAFDPSMESFANAVGLTQLTPPPAKRFAQGLPYSREALKDPAINVAIGAREMGDLWKRTNGDAALSIAGYNAGEGAVRRWLRAAKEHDTLDVFVEAIPYDETRGYTKRVLSSYFAYRWLYDAGDPVPPLPQPLHR